MVADDFAHTVRLTVVLLFLRISVFFLACSFPSNKASSKKEVRQADPNKMHTCDPLMAKKVAARDVLSALNPRHLFYESGIKNHPMLDKRSRKVKS
jgi:ABC-type oligopeptide transport system substrate-binding subunit